jgi:hypothetical protein
MNCPTCGASMSHFKNPDRWLCPKEGDHARIIAAQRQGGGTGSQNKGQARPKSKDNLPKKKDNPKKDPKKK